MTEALAVLERQLSEHQIAISKTRSGGVGNDSTTSGSGSGNIVDISSSWGVTPAVVSMLRRHVNAWRALACRRMLTLTTTGTSAAGGAGHDGMMPLASRTATSDEMSGVRKEVFNIYRYNTFYYKRAYLSFLII